TVPVVVDAGLGAPSHAAEAMELGADAVLVNTAIAVAAQPARMAVAFRLAVEAGRIAFETGLSEAASTPSATSPLTAFLDRTATPLQPSDDFDAPSLPVASGRTPGGRAPGPCVGGGRCDAGPVHLGQREPNLAGGASARGGLPT